MGKIKSKRGLLKRVRVTKSNKMKRHRVGRRHLLIKKDSRRKRRLRKHTTISINHYKTIKRILYI